MNTRDLANKIEALAPLAATAEEEALLYEAAEALSRLADLED